MNLDILAFGWWSVDVGSKSCNKYTIQCRILTARNLWMYGGEEGFWEFSYYAQFCCELETALKIQPIKKKSYCQQFSFLSWGVKTPMDLPPQWNDHIWCKDQNQSKKHSRVVEIVLNAYIKWRDTYSRISTVKNRWGVRGTWVTVRLSSKFTFTLNKYGQEYGFHLFPGHGHTIKFH